jgi:hypothetical protein
MKDRSAMRYILAYFALMLGLSGLSLLWAGEAYGFLFLLIAAALIYVLVRMERTRRREQRYGGYGMAIEGYEKRFTQAERELESKLPQNALDSPPVLELLSAYEHDPADADNVRTEHAQLRQRFLDWREEFERMRVLSEAGAVGLPKEFAEQYEQLGQQLRDLTADVKRLESRARDIDNDTEDPLDQIARAALKLEQAKATCAHRFAGKIPPELASQLAQGDAKLGQARTAIAKGAERPLDATRLSQEVYALASAAEESAGKLLEAPAGLDSECTRLDGEISAAKARLEAVAETCAPACLLEIKGCESEAEDSIHRARKLLAGQLGDVPLTQAKEALARAHVLVHRIDDHLVSLEQASLTARHQVEQAELQIDKAWASSTASSASPAETARAERIAMRTRELAAQARTELQRPQPDWFRVTALAERAEQLAHDLVAAGTTAGAPAPPVRSVRPEVEAARARAAATLDEIRPIVAEADGLFGEDNMARICLEHAEQAYEQAVASQTAQAAIEGFRLAEESANAAHDHAIGLRARAERKPTGKTATNLLWGAFGRPTAPE